MGKIFFTSLLILPVLIASSQDVLTKIDSTVTVSMNDYGIPGISLAIVNKENVFCELKKGKSNLEHNVNVKKESTYRLFSLTKIFVSVGVFQLIEKNQLDLEDTIGLFFNDIPKNWRNIKIKHLLTHSSGLPEIVPPDYNLAKDMDELEAKNRVFELPIKFDKNLKFDYN